MPPTAQHVTDQLLRRVRDPQGTAHSREFVRDIVSRAELIVNIATRAVTESASFPLRVHQQLYGPLSVIVPRAAKIIGVHDRSREVTEVAWNDIHHYDGAWFRRLGPEPQMWALVGRDMLLVHPGLEYDYPVQLIYSLVPDPLVTEIQEMLLPEQFTPLILDIAEVILLTKQRTLEGQAVTWQATFNRAFDRYGFTDEKRRARTSPSGSKQSSGPDAV